MKLLQYGLKLCSRSSRDRRSETYEEEVLDLNHYLDTPPGDYLCSNMSNLYWHGQEIGYISSISGNLTVRLGTSTFYFSKEKLKAKLLRDIMIEVVAQAKGFSKTNEMLELLKR